MPPAQPFTAAISPVSENDRDAAVDLLSLFFHEEGFSTPRDLIENNLGMMLMNFACWVALAKAGEQAVGIVTVTTMLYVEDGRLAEIGDLYVVPQYRGRGIARQLITAAKDWGSARGCSKAFVTLTPEGEAKHQLSQFYRRLDFRTTGRTTMILPLSN